MALPLVETTVLESLNSCLFCYGQTSSGKTYTMQGPATIGHISDAIQSQPYDDGIIQRAARDIFRLISEQQQEMEEGEEEEVTGTKKQYLVRVSFVELYNEQVRDLLSSSYSNCSNSNSSSGSSSSLTIRDVDGQVEIVGCTEVVVTSSTDLLETLSQGETNRTVAATGMNERSSRSHTIVRITVECHDILVCPSQSEEASNEDSNKENMIADSGSGAEVAAAPAGVRVATLNLVDLAGSESVKQTGATGDRRKEGGLINQSLLALSRVISARAAASSNSTSSAAGNGGGTNKVTTAKFVNYRDSKLTRILRPALSGDAKMAVICCASQSNRYVDETKSTLQFASRAKRVTTNAKVHEVMSDEQSMIRRLQKELDVVKQQLLEHQRGLQQKQKDSTSYNQEHKKESLFDLIREKEERFNKLVLQATTSVQFSSTSRQNKKKNDRRMTFGHSLHIPVSETSLSFSSPLPTKPKNVAAAPNTTGRQFLRLIEDDLVGVCPGDESCNGTSKLYSVKDAALQPQQELRLVQESLAVQRTQRQLEEDSFREVIKEQNTALHEKDEIISKLKTHIASLQEENFRLYSLLQTGKDKSVDSTGSGVSFDKDGLVSDNATEYAGIQLDPVENEPKIECQDEGVKIDDDDEDETNNVVSCASIETSTINSTNRAELVSAWGRFIAVECDDSRLKSAWGIFVRHFALYVVWSYVFDMPNKWWPENNNGSPANRIRYTYADRSDAEKQQFDDAAMIDFKISQEVWDRVKKDGDIKKFTAGMKRRSKNGRLPRFQIVAEYEFGLVEFLDSLWPDRTLIRDTEDDEENAQD
mmetsp:Transcript_53400/g.129933  ORF Transcript_53400/g.129933 Transcript_53400/m.129933 type:complete len:817 (+) Transcript_53400:559-3009(+)